MAMALVGATIPSEEIHVSLTLCVPEINALASLCHHGLWPVIFAHILFILIDIVLATGEFPYTIWGFF
jgi:hypothetical protein